MTMVVWVVAWLLSGVSVSAVIRFVAYEGLLIVAPGTLLYAVLRGPGRGTIVGLGVGWALGYAIEIGAFALAGELHAPLIQPCVQGIVAVSSLAALRVRRGSAGRASALARPWHGSSAWRWSVGGVAGLAVVYISLAYFTQTPLPGHFARVDYLDDVVFALSLAAEALHHWPITDPSVAGLPLPYETFASMHLAAVSRVTRIALPTVLLRLYIVPMISLLALQLSAAGSVITGRRWAGPISAALVLFVGELHPTPNGSFIFANNFFVLLFDSPTFLLGLVLFVPGLWLIWWLGPGQDQVGQDAAGQRDSRPGGWIALTMLMVASSGAKATILPVIMGGAAGYVATAWYARRRRAQLQIKTMIKVFGLALLVFCVSYVVIYQGEGNQFTIDPPGLVRVMGPTLLVDPASHALPVSIVLWLLLVLLGVLGYCGAFLAPVVAAGVIFRDWLLRPHRVFLFATAAVSLIPTLVLSNPGWDENYFFSYGYVALALLSGDAVLSVLDVLQPRARTASLGWLAGIGMAVPIAATAIAIAVLGKGDEEGLYLVAAGVLAGVLVLSAAGWGMLRRGNRLLAARRVVVIPLIALATYGAFDAPLSVVPNLYLRLRAGEPVYPVGVKNLTPALLAGLDWIRERTSVDAVLAVNNQYLGADRTHPNFMYYSAFAQRRVFLEGWEYTTGAAKVGLTRVYFHNAVVYPKRLALSDAVFATADPSALRQLVQRYGVDYLVVDKVNGGPSPALARLAKPLFSNSAITIYSASTVLAHEPVEQ